MKKAIIVLLILITLTACTAQEESKQESIKINDYYPFLENTKLIYQGQGNEFAGREVYFDFINGNYAQLRIDTGGTTLARIIEIKNGELRVLSNQEEFYQWQKLDMPQKNDYEILLKKPLTVGTTWTLDDGRKRYISDKNVKVTIPQGEYNALEVTTEGEEYQNFDYYVKDIGLVLSKFKTDQNIIKTSLAEIKKDSAVVKKIKVFYPDFSAEDIKYINKNLKFKTNDRKTAVFAKLLREKGPKDLTPLISNQTKINNIEVKQSENIVKVDFSKELVTDMNAGHLLETLIIQSIVNTFGHYYHVDHVYLSLAGEPYQSGHIMIEEGDYFEVEEDIIKYKN